MKANIDNNICPNCNIPLVLKTSKEGNKFYGCSNYPKCKFTKKIQQINLLNFITYKQTYNMKCQVKSGQREKNHPLFSLSLVLIVSIKYNYDFELRFKCREYLLLFQKDDDFASIVHCKTRVL